MKHILVVGSINMDYVIHTARLPKLGETITGEQFAINYGGKGANQAVATAKQGCETKMLGAVGSDLAGGLAKEYLSRNGVDCSPILTTNAPTGAAVITVCGGDNHIILDIGANACVTPEVISARQNLFDWADMVILQYEIPTESVLAAAKTAQAHNCRVVLNPAPVKEVDPALYRYVDLIIPNEFEATLLTGIEVRDRESAVPALQALKQLGCHQALITLGKQGCAAISETGEITYEGIFEVQTVDTTAAGDSFIGGLCTMLCEGLPMRDAIRYASAVSALTVSRHGASASIPTAEEVADFLKEVEIT